MMGITSDNGAILAGYTLELILVNKRTGEDKHVFAKPGWPDGCWQRVYDADECECINLTTYDWHTADVLS